jgi:uncharacterized protein YndB with AHSA1/START domain
MSESDPQLNGQLALRDGRAELRFTRRLAQPPAAVWLALTEPDQLRAWFPADIVGERVAGAPLRFDFRNGEGPTIDGEMLVCEPPSLLEFRWGTDTLRFEVRPDGDGSLLTFVNTFDQPGKAARDAAGWHSCLDLLALHLVGEASPFAPGERWAQIHASYVERFPPEASTIGPPV